ncbi:MAG: hypothetical protein ACRDBX_08800 [Erysipelotrichaceae bacterium]
MKLKRRIFAYLTMMLTLSGCVGSNVMSSYANIEQGAESEVLFKTYSTAEALAEPVLKTEMVTEKTALAKPRTEVRAYDGRAGLPWLASKISNGKPSYQTQDYVITKDHTGTVLSKTPLLGATGYIDAEPAIIQYGSNVVAGATFQAKITTYGVDCVGCSGQTTGKGNAAIGLPLTTDSVMQNNGSFAPGIKYGNYYLVAADPNIPMCSILEVSNHGFSGYGLSPNTPFQAVVVDRGGAIKGAKLDFFKGSQKNYTLQLNRSLHNPQVKIIRVGGKISKNRCAV